MTIVIMEKDKKNANTYLDIIYKQYVAIDDAEINKSKKVFTYVLNKVTEKMSQKCNFFKKYAITNTKYAGSVYDGTKVSKFNEFDMNIVINLPINNNTDIIIENEEPGFIKMKIISAFDNLDTQLCWEKCHVVTRDWRDKDKYFLQNKFRNWLHGLVQKAVTEMRGKATVDGVTYSVSFKESGPAYTFTICNTEDEEFIVDIDLVPVIKFQLPKWPDTYREMRQTHIKEWLAVPKPNKSLEDVILKNRCWRLSFQDFESELMKGCQYLKITLRLVKKLRDALGMKAIASYYIKTLFLWKTNSKHYWETPIYILLLDMLQYLHDAIQDKNIPYYWHEKHNLISDLKPTLQKEYTGNLVKVINSLKAYHTNQFVGFFLTSEELQKFQKIHIHSLDNKANLNMIKGKANPGGEPQPQYENNCSSQQTLDCEAKGKWFEAQSPNYDKNIDKRFPYSEVPYVGEHKLIKIPFNGLVDHIDYWGEGRIITSDGVSGFPNCYNVNLQYQLVSRGPDCGRKIPNRVPVNSTECNSSGYIKDNSVAIVTVMGAQINDSCAADIVRMVSKQDGLVVLYGFENDSMDVQNLKQRLESKEIIWCPGYELSPRLSGITKYESWSAYLSAKHIKQELYHCVINQHFDRAVNISKSIQESDNGSLINDIVMKLLDYTAEVKYTMGYAYKLWHSDAKNVVKNYFPKPFRFILNNEYLIIQNKKDGLALKLDANVDKYNDRRAWGDSQDRSSNRMSWQFIPVWEDNMVYYKIKNINTNMYLKLDVNRDSYNDRQAWGSINSNQKRHLWYLRPIKYNDEILFFIVNHEYKQGLKLDARTDSYNDRLLWGHHGSVYGDPVQFGWFLRLWT